MEVGVDWIDWLWDFGIVFVSGFGIDAGAGIGSGFAWVVCWV